MFLVSKLVGLATTPMLWVLLLLGLGCALMVRRPVIARRMLVLATSIMLLGGWAVIPDALLRHLERQYPDPPAQPLSRYVGVIVLGGATESTYRWEGTQEPQMNASAERMTTLVPLMRQAPGMRILFTGGEGEYFGSGPTEADRARRIFAQLGLDAGRIDFEDASRNTYDNAVLSARIPGIDPHQPWILLTSAVHMPRALAVFRKQGWNVTPYSVDFNAGLATPWTLYIPGDLSRWDLALHEYVGIAAYRLIGRM